VDAIAAGLLRRPTGSRIHAAPDPVVRGRDTAFRSTPSRAMSPGTNETTIHFLEMNTTIGLFAAFCTTVSYFPQLKKCWDTGSAGDLSLTMFLILALGVATWIVYGVLQRDLVIILANALSLCLLLGILYFKLREPSHRARTTPY
jgi:MtN3 and saliva related transmembrane protein